MKATPNGSGWLARVLVRDYDGTIRPIRRRGATKGAAETALRKALVDWQAPVREAEVTPDTKVAKVGELWLAEFERTVDAGRRSPGSLDSYRSIFRRHVLPALGELRVREVTTPVVDRALTVIAQRTVSGARTAKTVISRVMSYAARHGAIAVNPAREVGRIDSSPRNPPRALSAAERQDWLAALRQSPRAQDWDLADLTLMMLATGCRIGECLAIGWSEVDLSAMTVDVCWKLVRRTGVGLLRLPSTKSGRKGERIVPLPSWAVTMLKERQNVAIDGVEPLFPSALGGWRDPSNVRRVWRQVAAEAEIAGLVSHTLRKTVATFLDDADVSPRKIADQLGHSKVSMTQDVYLGRKLTDRQTADVLDLMFGDDGPGGKDDPKMTRDLGREPGATP